MEYIDLHMHSLFSDGTDSPDELVRRAKEAGLSMIALTDHNTLDGIMDFREACRRHGMTGIGGIELSTGWEEAVPPAAADGSQTAGSKPGFPDKEPPEIHILGYFPEDADDTVRKIVFLIGAVIYDSAGPVGVAIIFQAVVDTRISHFITSLLVHITLSIRSKSLILHFCLVLAGLSLRCVIPRSGCRA